MSEIYELAAHLPEGVHWGEAITPDIMKEILASVQPSALKEKLRCAEERIAELEQQPRAVPERQRHIANEWADMATNGVQWLRNIKAGTSTVDDALAEMEQNMQRIAALRDAPPPPAQTTMAAQDAVDFGIGLMCDGRRIDPSDFYAEPPPEQAEPKASRYHVEMRGSRLWIVIDHQSFPLDFQPKAEPGCTAAEHLAWYERMVRIALDRLAGSKAQAAGGVGLEALEELVQQCRRTGMFMVEDSDCAAALRTAERTLLAAQPQPEVGR